MANVQISGLTQKASPVADTDQFAIDDSKNASWKVTGANLKTYFDGRYALKGVNSDITSLTGLSGIDAIHFSDNATIRCGSATGKTLTLEARDFDGATDVVFATITSANTPSCAFVQPAGGLLTWDGGAIGATTQANAQFLSPVNAQTGTTYTLAASDCGKIVTFNNGAAITVTLPQQSNVTTATGFWCRMTNLGVGTVTLVKEGSETLTGNTLLATNANAVVERTSSTNWNVEGGTAVRTGSYTWGPIQTVGNNTYNFAVANDAITLTSAATICRSGTCTATFNINGTPVTATANSVSSSYETRSITGANTATNGDLLTCVVTSNSSCLDMSFTVNYTFLVNI